MPLIYFKGDGLLRLNSYRQGIQAGKLAPLQAALRY